MRKLALLTGFLLGMAAESQAQVLQYFRKGGDIRKYDAGQVDSLRYNLEEGVTTIYFGTGQKETVPIEDTDSIVWYEPQNSIFYKLQNNGNYKNFLRLVQENSLWTDQMSGSTDLTVFAADDNGWQRFFAGNALLPQSDPWHTATSYEALTAEQKRTLLAAAIISPQKIADDAGIGGNAGKLRVKGATDLEEVWTPILTPAYCEKNGITEKDQGIIFGTALSAPRIAGNSFVEADVACGNGWLEQMSVPLRPLGTMADVIRTNGQTNIIAYILDRIDKNELKFDPAWAGYYDEMAPEKDMAAMFVPSDKTMWSYFTEGAGQTLLHTYYAKEGTAEAIPYIKPQTQDELFSQIESIPASLLVHFIRSNMMRSFLGSVPSKWNKLVDDAMDPLFDNVGKSLSQLDTCIMAGNGAVYVFDKVFAPADFGSVTAPAFMSNTSRIMSWAVYDQESMGLNFYAYLKAPQQDITFFLPSDPALFYYYDPLSMTSRQPRAIEFYFVGGSFPIKARMRNYNREGAIGNVIAGTNTYTNDELLNRLKDILKNSTIVSDETQDIHSRNEYFRTFGGDVVKVVRNDGGKIIGAKGGFQLENERKGLSAETPGIVACNVTDSYENLTNGQTYTLSAPLVPTYRNLWSMLSDDGKADYAGNTDSPYSEFYKLCRADWYESIIEGCGLVDASFSSANRKAALRKFYVFAPDKGLYELNFALLTGNTPYTAYIPTNEAVKAAIAQGLPTWEDIEADYESHSNAQGLLTIEDSMRIAEKIMILTDVVKAHFHFGMAFADKEPFQRQYRTLAMDINLGVAHKLNVSSQGDGQMTVTDWNGQTCNVVGEKNIPVRDYTCNNSPAGVSMRGIVMNGHRSGIIHQIDGVLGFTK